MESQMTFSNTAGCPQFSPNPFKADMCQTCLAKIYSHSGATSSQVSAALEFSVSKVPSLVTESLGAKLFLGGYKAAVNVSWLREERVRLVVDTAGGLETVLGPGYGRAKERRRKECPEVRVITLYLRDDLVQRLEEEELKETVREVVDELGKGGAVLVHCAQGRSRSTVLVLCILCWSLDLSLTQALTMVQERRAMAEPNSNFMEQLSRMEREGRFQVL